MFLQFLSHCRLLQVLVYALAQSFAEIIGCLFGLHIYDISTPFFGYVALELV
jgi:zinc transporter ZupT